MIRYDKATGEFEKASDDIRTNIKVAPEDVRDFKNTVPLLGVSVKEAGKGTERGMPVVIFSVSGPHQMVVNLIRGYHQGT